MKPKKMTRFMLISSMVAGLAIIGIVIYQMIDNQPDGPSLLEQLAIIAVVLFLIVTFLLTYHKQNK